jgi:flagella basal body P-ring formation protein FlgA
VAVNPAQYTGLVESSAPPKYARPLLVRAGDTVRLCLQDEKVRIEMTGVAEQSARDGEPVVVRVTHQSDDAGLTVERIAGIVRAPGDVEMER